MTIYMLFLPLFICVAFKTAVGIRLSNLTLAVVNDELPSRLSTSCDSYAFHSNGCNFSTTLSCELLNILTQMDYRIVLFDEVDVAKVSKPSAVLYFGKNFSASLEKRLTLTGTESEVAGSDILVWQDDSNYVVSTQINFDLGHSCETLFNKLYAACDWIPTANRLPVLFNEAIYGSSLKSFNESTSANLCAALLFYLTMYFTMTSILWERLDGKLERTLISGGKFVEVCLAQLAIQCFYMITCIVIVWTVMYSWFESPFAGSASYGIAFLILNSFVGVFNGLFFALLVSKLYHGTLLGIAVFMSLCLIGGVCWPVEGVYWILKSVLWLCPGVYGNIAFESIALRGDIFNASIYKGIINDVAWIIIFTVGSIYASKKIMLNLKQ